MRAVRQAIWSEALALILKKLRRNEAELVTAG